MTAIPVRSIQPVAVSSSSTDCLLRSLDQIMNGQDIVEGLHRHDFFYVLVLQKGAGTHTIDFTAYPVGDNTIFWLRPGQVHALTLQAGSVGYMLQVAPGFLDVADKKRVAGWSPLFLPDAPVFQHLYQLLELIAEEQQQQRMGFEEVVKACLRIFLVALSRLAGASSTGRKDPYQQERMDELMGLLEIHVAQYKQVSQYAAMMNLSAFQLNAITASLLGKTASAVINDYILLEARRQLLATTGPVGEIARQLGYEDVSYFIRFFKKHMGQSPGLYRKNYR